MPESGFILKEKREKANKSFSLIVLPFSFFIRNFFQGFAFGDGNDMVG